MARKKYVLLSLVTRQKLTKEPYGRKILTLFYDHYPLLAPQYANYYEPINNYVSSPEEALVYWEGDPFLCRRKISIGGWWYVSEDITKIGYLKIKYDWSSKIEWFKLFKELVLMTGAYFGYVHIFTEREIEPAGAGSAIDCFIRGTPGIHLKKGIPNLGRVIN